MEQGFTYCRFATSSPSFATDEARPQWIPDHEVELKHIKFELTLLPEEEKVKGKVTHELYFRNNFEGPLSLDAVSLAIHSVKEGEKDLPFENTGETLEIDLSAKRGDTRQIVIDYEVTKPKAGIYFVKPDNQYPTVSEQVWTQGQDEDTKFYAPVFDNPIWKATTEVIGRIPKNWTSLSNGKLVDDRIEGEFRIMHWKFDFRHSIYLVTFAAGDLAEHVEKWEDVEIRWYFQKGREKEAENAYRETANILKFFSEFTKFKYPYGSYSQWSASRFIFGGMENTSATTQTDLTLRDDRALLDSTSNNLVAHEAAHQWFGDWVTAKSWSHAWLHESFATYFDALYTEHSLGREEFVYQMLRNAKAYFNETTRLYKRPIVTNIYAEPIDIFDGHLYPGGSWRVHMLRVLLGDDDFRDALRIYLERHGQGHVETVDLARAMEEVSGKSLDWFFDQWVYKAGFPQLKISYQWDAKYHLAKVTIKQTQKVEKDDKWSTEIFRIPTFIQFQTEDGMSEFPIEITDKEHTFVFSLTSKPKMVRFDPRGDVLCKVDFEKSEELLIYQLENDTEVIGQIRAIEEMKKKPSQKVIDALRRKLLNAETFWGVKATIATALAKIGGQNAKEILLEASTEKHPKTRRAIIEALGSFKEDKEVADALIEKINKGDESYFVEAELLKSLGTIGDERAYEIIPQAMMKPTFNDLAIIYGLEGLAQMVDERSFDVALEYSAYGKPELGRNTAIRLLGILGRKLPTRKEKAFEKLKIYSKDRLFRARLAAISGLTELGDPRGIAILKEMQGREVDGRMKKLAHFGIKKIRKDLSKPTELENLQNRLDSLEKENKKLREKVEVLEAKSH
ncbi:MAG: hypothetical protein D6732_07125 [Methanobacteriota archaeon]|nr:MAG: hypothetical protein D6732_07125 [Euryarchaeota archaeon]